MRPRSRLPAAPARGPGAGARACPPAPERILLEAADPDREGGSFGGYLPTLGIFLIFPVFLKKNSRFFYEIH